MIEYQTQAGEVLDQICFRYYGRTQRYTEAVREANPQLSEHSVILPAGVTIVLPALDALAIEEQTIRLWD